MSPSIVAARDAFAKVVGLHLAGGRVEVATAPFPINLIVIIGHQDSAGDDALSESGLYCDFYTTEEYVKTGPDIRSVASFRKGELGAVSATVLDHSLVCERPI